MNHIYLGQNVLTGKDIYIPIEEFGKSSTHILGKSQVGKSKESERIARDIIKSEYGLLVIDGKGDLYNGLLDFCTVLKYPPHQLALIDPTDDYCPGINFLECLNGVSPDTQAGIIIDCFKKFFGEHDETKHWLEEYGPASLDPLSRQGFALTELFEFLLTDPSFRHAVLQQSGISSHFMRKWKDLEESYKNRPSEIAKILSSPKTRADIFRRDRFLEGVFGQTKTTIDWRKVMDEGGLVLANLHEGTRAQPKGLKFTGAAIIYQVYQTAMQRPEGNRRRFFVMIDEFQKFLTPDIASSLDQLNGLGVSFILAHQHLTQLQAKEPEIAASVMTNCRNKIVFNISRTDAEIMYPELFPGRIHTRMKEVKDEISPITFRPIIEWIDTSSETESEGGASSSSSGRSSGSSYSMASTIPDDIQVPGSETVTDGWSEGSIDVNAETSTFNRGITHNSPVPMVTGYEEFEQVTGRTFYTEPEVKEELIAWINTQKDRHFQCKIGDHRPTIPLRSPFVKKINVWPPNVDDLKQKVYNLIGRLKDDVSREVESRARNFVEKHRQQQFTNDSSHDEPIAFKEPKSRRTPPKE